MQARQQDRSRIEARAAEQPDGELYGMLFLIAIIAFIAPLAAVLTR